MHNEGGDKCSDHPSHFPQQEVRELTQTANRGRGRADIMSRKKRSQLMSTIGPRNTKPELVVRSALRNLGYRYRPYGHGMAGKPDIVLSKQRTVIFVHGCFWHQHPGCGKATIPKQHADFWRKKLTGNRVRDRRTERKLRRLGWHVLVVWECQTKNKQLLSRMLSRKLNTDPVSTRL